MVIVSKLFVQSGSVETSFRPFPFPNYNKLPFSKGVILETPLGWDQLNAVAVFKSYQLTVCDIAIF